MAASICGCLQDIGYDIDNTVIFSYKILHTVIFYETFSRSRSMKRHTAHTHACMFNHVLSISTD